MDETDRELLALLQEDCRMSYGELGGRVGLSISAVNERLKKLHARGVIRGCVAVLEPRAVGLDVCAFVQVLIERPEHDAAFLAAIGAMPAVLECHHVTGDFSYLLKVRVADTAALETFLSRELKGLAGVVRTHTAIALSSAKEATALDLAALSIGTRGERR
ncbi:MAG TPA: Lrp/AsnC family transcriptional regulator [Thermomicrobiales bacterium]|jgi:Lrp/AsnC family leucine-responsive transcriptional regulator